jgi:hypothetical protein
MNYLHIERCNPADLVICAKLSGDSTTIDIVLSREFALLLDRLAKELKISRRKLLGLAFEKGRKNFLL